MSRVLLLLAAAALAACAPATDDGAPDAGGGETYETGPYTGTTTASWTLVSESLAGSFHCFASAGDLVYAGSGYKTAQSAGNEFGLVAISRDQGATWAATTLTANVSDLAIAGSTVWATTLQGVRKSTDEGATWTNVTVPNAGTTIFNSVAVRGSRVFVAAGTAVHYSDDDGATWTKVLTWLDGSYTYVTRIHPFGDVLVATAKGNLQVSTDNGVSWNEREDGLPYNPFSDGAALASDALFVATSEGVYRATLAAGAFEKVSDQRGSIGSRQTALFSSPGNGRSGSVLISVDQGTTWTDFHTGLPAGVSPTAFHPVGKYLLASMDGRIWRTALY